MVARLGPEGFGPRQALASNADFHSASFASSSAGALFCLARRGDAQPLGCAWAAAGAEFGPLEPVPGPLGVIDAALDARGQATLAVAGESGTYAVQAPAPGRWGSPLRLDAMNPGSDMSGVRCGPTGGVAGWQPGARCAGATLPSASGRRATTLDASQA